MNNGECRDSLALGLEITDLSELVDQRLEPLFRGLVAVLRAIGWCSAGSSRTDFVKAFEKDEGRVEIVPQSALLVLIELHKLSREV
jgi:hypothetical protein